MFGTWKPFTLKLLENVPRPYRESAPAPFVVESSEAVANLSSTGVPKVPLSLKIRDHPKSIDIKWSILAGMANIFWWPNPSKFEGFSYTSGPQCCVLISQFNDLFYQGSLQKVFENCGVGSARRCSTVERILCVSNNLEWWTSSGVLKHAILELGELY